jgi:UDP-N-acetyl-D-glucosamine dehydrogenase
MTAMAVPEPAGDPMPGFAELRKRILNRLARVAVLGQGYVGLSLACGAAAAGFQVIGFDVDQQRIEQLSDGVLSVPGVLASAFHAGLATGGMTFTTEAASLGDADVLAICVPTPLRDGVPDLSFVERACREVAGQLTAGRLVILESTTYPGTTEQLVRPLLELSGLAAGEGYLLAYSPERIDPGNQEFGLRNTPRIVGGTTPLATELAGLFYGQVVDKVVPVSSARAAELAKLLENTFRHVNIALVNEMAMLCHETGADVWEVIEAAASKPFGYMAFHPGPGVGGHCIPLDPTYLAWQVRRDAGRQFRILEQAEDINAQMPAYTASRIGEALNDVGLAVRGSKILVLGVAYKPDVGDIRESPAVKVIAQLHRRGADVSFHDPYVETVSANGKVLTRAELTEQTVASAHCVAILTPHRAYDLEWIAATATCVFDSRDAYGPNRHPNVIRL